MLTNQIIMIGKLESMPFYNRTEMPRLQDMQAISQDSVALKLDQFSSFFHYVACTRLISSVNDANKQFIEIR